MKFPGMNSQTKPEESVHNSTPLISNFNDCIRPTLDAVDKLRHLKVMDEGIQLPTIIVVGDKSSGKSSVLESLSGINLPRGQGICTRVPLIMRLQNHSSPEPKLHLEYHGKKVPTDGTSISEAICSATGKIAVNKKGIPDLTMVDLPGITRVRVHGPPEDIYEQINNIIMEYIKPKESIILIARSSIRISSKVDKTGERTLAIFTKVDKSPEGLLEKVTADDVNIETYEEARIEEATLFRSHPLLSKIDKSIVGVLATSISNCLPDIVKKINQNAAELNNMPRNLSSIADAVTAFMRSKSPWNNNKDSFLTEEVKVLGETKGIGLPKFLPRTAFLTILQRRVEVIAETPVEFAQKLQSFTRWEAHNVMAKVRNNSIERVKEIVEMEKMAAYSCSPDYISTWTRLMLQQQQFKDVMNDGSKPKNLQFEMLGDVEFGHLKDTQIVQQAFDINMRLMSYWKIVLRRLVDSLALHLLFTVQNLVNKDMEQDITSELMGGPSGCGGIERLLEESPSVATKRDKLNRSIKLLRDSKDVVAKIIDCISLNG
ncbi:hypothetical protein MKX03_005783 [Papaver bracteatum]|nr:hypothetical protein MKX03_005783 [Papaver bracteatum]